MLLEAGCQSALAILGGQRSRSAPQARDQRVPILAWDPDVRDEHGQGRRLSPPCRAWDVVTARCDCEHAGRGIHRVTARVRRDPSLTDDTLDEIDVAAVALLGKPADVVVRERRAIVAAYVRKIERILSQWSQSLVN